MKFDFTEPVTIIVGYPDLYVNKGSTINLTCVVKYAPEPPPSMTWSHNAEVNISARHSRAMINQDRKAILHSVERRGHVICEQNAILRGARAPVAAVKMARQ